MSKALIVAAVVALGLAFWAYKGVQMFRAYQLAVAEITAREDIENSLGAYDVGYDWWFGAFRALRYGSVQEFEFHLNGEHDSAVAAVSLRRDSGWKITCISVVNGEYLNNRILQEC